MQANKTRVLLVLPQDLLDRSRVLAGKATASLKLPVSVQIVVRALVEEGLKRTDDRALLTNIENQAKAVRRIRSTVRQRGRRAQVALDR
jgi:predicted RNA-binding Zn ribbon-like protein